MMKKLNVHSTNSASIPKIRLKGFRENWENDKLGNFTSSFSGGTPSAGVSDFYGGDIPFIRSGEIHDNKTQLFLTEAGLNCSSARIVEKGTLLYALYGATSGEVAISKIKGAINQAILAVYPDKSVDKNFLSHFLASHKNEIIRTLLQGGQGNLSGALVKSIIVAHPKIEEQKNIATYLDNLDSLISSTTSRVASLKQTKAASLQAMFPQEGETVPRIRFKGFDGKWKKVKLNECLNVCNDKNINNIYTKEDVLSVSDDFGICNQIQLLGRSYAGKSVTNYGILKTGDIVYTKSPLKVKPYGIIKTNHGPSGIVSTLYAIYSPKVGTCSDFIEYYFDLPYRMNRYIHPLVNKGAKNDMKVSSENALKGYIMIPSYEEQQQIASYFTSLDKQISLQSQRLEKLKQIKSACLDKMFV